MAKFSRRQFLKTLGLAGTAALAGCSEPARHLVPYVIPPEDIVPGEATWYATTCRECPAGCGMLAKNRDGHVIKVEGNPRHPVNTGRLCARGQASVQGLYNPDRFRQPMLKDATGRLQPVSWDQAMKRAIDAIGKAGQKRVVFMSHLMTGSEAGLARRWADAVNGQYVVYEPYAYEALRKANRIVFGADRIPDYRIDLSDLLISFGANFLETWVSNVRFTRQFSVFHEPKQDRKNLFIYVGPRLSLTAANADHFIPVPPGGERYVALGLLNLLVSQGLSSGMTGMKVPADISAFTPGVVEARAGVQPDTLKKIAQHFLRARRPLALAEGMGFQDMSALETAVAANLLCTLSPGSRDLLDFGNFMSLGEIAPASDIKRLTDDMANGRIGAMILYRANPVYSLPAAWGFETALSRVPVVISLSSFPDETTARASLVMPSSTFLESWGDYSPQAKVTGLLQPAMGTFFDTRQLGDILLALGKAMAGQEKFPEKDLYDVLRNSWGKTGGGVSPEAAWQESLRQGGSFGLNEKSQPARGKGGSFSFSPPATPDAERRGTFDLFTYPTIQFFDGRLANRPVLQEMPDPVTQVTWDACVEIHPETARKMGIKKGDVLELHADNRSIRAPAFPCVGIPEGALAIPIGQGHAPSFSRYARTGDSGNPTYLPAGRLDAAGGIIRTVRGVTIQKTGHHVPVAHADGDAYQHGRRIARSLTFARYAATKNSRPRIDMPLPEGWDKRKDFYPAHKHAAYRWGMVIDIDRCIGCEACVIACYMENNVGIVGKDNVLLGRQMSWIHVERYYEPDQPYIRFIPLLCQHCDSAPCESVCPMFAPNHSQEGINNQVYNRCIGTRDCNINCPWKVRRFNWFTWGHDYPLGWQLNPDVTVRQKGVMEKCSFCIQRVVKAKTDATSEHRKIKDGEFTTACAQTCPADAIVFGNLMDPESRVSKLLNQGRAYQALGELNTKPAVIYLKKITQEL